MHMITGKEDIVQALIEAFLMEKGTREFYSRAAGKAVNLQARKIFAELSEWENRHMDFIQFLYQSLQGNREVKSFEEFSSKTQAPLTEAGIPVKDLEAKAEKYNFKNETEALALAMEIEVKAYELYRRLSQNTADTSVKVVFEEMAEQETRHINYLKKMRQAH
ncbi:MAG: ferritin family protein [Nitrospirota bacterium]